MANIIDQRNIQLRLVWLHKWHTGYVGFPMWEPMAQEWFDRDLRIKRIRARDYLILRRKDSKVVQLRRFK